MYDNLIFNMKLTSYVPLLLYLYLNFIKCEEIIGLDSDVHMLKPGFEKLLLSSTANSRLQIFCYPGESKNFVTLLKTIELVVKVPQNNFKYYEGANYSSVRDLYDGSSWFSYTPWRPSSFQFDIYNLSCIGIETSETYQASLKVRYVDLWRVLSLALGVFLFIMAPLLAHNVIFHYVTGVSVGILGSLLLIVLILSRFVPKKAGALTFLIGGWGLFLYILQHFWNNCTSFVKDYHTYATGYVIVSGFISFAMVYRRGPIKDARTLQLVQWALQLTGLIAIFSSSQHKEFTLAMILILLFNYNIPTSWKMRIKTYWLRKFPPQRRLLSNDEYFEQSRIETEKGLEELKKFCHSPDCNAWKTMSRLKTPHRFAEFVEGASHLTDDEILSYESLEYRLATNREDEELFTSDEED